MASPVVPGLEGLPRSGTPIDPLTQQHQGQSAIFAATSPDGLDWAPCEGYALDQSTSITGNHLDAPVTWGATTRITAADYRPVVLRFKLHQATLFGFEVVA